MKKKVSIEKAEDNTQYLLLGSRECETLFGYTKDGIWFANADTEDYELSRNPTHIVSIDNDIQFLYDSTIQVVPQEYQVVQLEDGRYQVAYLSKKYPFVSKQDWHLDVFGECVISPSKVLGSVLDIHFSLAS